MVTDWIGKGALLIIELQSTLREDAWSCEGDIWEKKYKIKQFNLKKVKINFNNDFQQRYWFEVGLSSYLFAYRMDINLVIFAYI